MTLSLLVAGLILVSCGEGLVPLVVFPTRFTLFDSYCDLCLSLTLSLDSFLPIPRCVRSSVGGLARGSDRSDHVESELSQLTDSPYQN